ncbi:cytochrome c biogenesis protein CcmG/thiol:disulfide interchange protein DsbE [Azomonas agilis]|uniref:Cytochrome c biogenesis protein CcmG/thiol:disulfide interchange protein DsbE n=1 Tax=Azomonas agilis TaxID=116849 RepID=A0A562I1L7_9GAMM|nr:DsbE family thiol:disulfide interchange protein [Azomonas agilis]TWH64921.1 cytochrome c biogenesis protein CcmG/thiol:disulfide interchange protein DsbE [Azomonas agilis]
MKRLVLLVPLVAFLLLTLFLYRGLFLKPEELPSALIGKPIPAFSLPAVEGQSLITDKDLLGRPALLNVWATWCVACRVEHPVLNRLAAQGVLIYGVNYKDDNAMARQWLADFLNPYRLNIQDAEGRLGFDLGVYGAPETFLLDKNGIIRHKFVGVITDQVWREQLAPLYQELQGE